MEREKTKDESRREFLINAGKLAIYTPPALMLLMHPSKAAACTSAGGKRPEGQWDFKAKSSRGRTTTGFGGIPSGRFSSRGVSGGSRGGRRGHRS